MNNETSGRSQVRRFLLVSSFNVSNLAALLSKDRESPMIRAASAPFGQVMQTLLDPSGEVWRGEFSGAIIWTSPESVISSYAKLLVGEDVDPDQVLREVDDFCAAIKAVPSHVKTIFMPTWITAPFQGRLGLLDMHSWRGLSLALMRMNVKLAENFQGDPRATVLDAGRWVAVHGEKSFSQRLWYMSKTPYSVELFKEAALEIRAAIRALAGQAKKLIVVDLDETLWGGVVGDLGWQNLRLGGHDPIGEAFKDFQLALKALKRRGVLLGIVSKNEESIALEAIRSHPEMALRQDDFAGWRINWQDKAQNIADLAFELNLGLQSVVFIDDNPVERARLREALPEVLVPEWPENPMDYGVALQKLRCFDRAEVTTEDGQRSDMYVRERKRREARAEIGSLDQWLETLEIRVSVEGVNSANLERVTQLLNKTNQMNLSTRRLTKEEIWDWSQQPENTMLAFRVADKFGDYGLVGIGSFSLEKGNASVVVVTDFVLSCRVMGRKIEETMLHVLVGLAKGARAGSLHAEYIPTSKNQPCLAFLQRSGLAKKDGATIFDWDLRQDYAKPSAVMLVFEAANGSAKPSELQQSSLLTHA